MQTTPLSLQDKLYLTCSRTGHCCFGNLVMLNPWELAFIAKEKGVTAREFRDKYTEYGGTRLLFNGSKGWRGKQACNQYIENFGCSVHVGRPFACRLFPIGREMQNGKLRYMHQGEVFPCLERCPEVTDLAQLTVEEYLVGQQISKHEKAHDAYMDFMQNLADVAFALLLDTGLAESGDKATLAKWQKMGKAEPEALAKNIGKEWLDSLVIPEISAVENPIAFAQKHYELLQQKLETILGSLQSNKDIHQACVLAMSLALHMARSLGANPEQLSEHWINIAKQNGAQE